MNQITWKRDSSSCQSINLAQPISAVDLTSTLGRNYNFGNSILKPEFTFINLL